jgi:hypothetical protein
MRRRLPDLKMLIATVLFGVLSMLMVMEPAGHRPSLRLARVYAGERPRQGAGAPATNPAATQPAEQRKPHAPPRTGEVRELDIKALGNFEYDPPSGKNVPDDVQRLSGMKVRLHGFMAPLDQVDHVSHFLLVPGLFSCCFGQPPSVQHTIVVNCGALKDVNVEPEQVTVEGVLTVKEVKEEGYTLSVFEVAATGVKAIPWH